MPNTKSEKGPAELHRHLDCSIRPSTIAAWSRKNRRAEFRTASEVRNRFWITRPMESLEAVIGRLALFQKILDSTEMARRVAREVVEDASAEGISLLELRYSPRFASAVSGIPWQELLSAFEEGLKSAFEITGLRAGLICIVSRGEGLGVAHEAIDFAIANRHRFIGVDLAGIEAGHPCRLYAEVFRKARDAGLPATVHAGEGDGPKNIWEAIELLGARRIGHGCRAIEDRELLKRLARDQILLETCPASNVMTRAVASFEVHPLPRFLEAGIPCSISTDDPGIFGTTLQDEFEQCRTRMGMSEADLEKCRTFAKRHSF